MGDNKNDVLFGTAVFGGFNRKDVMNYIDELQKRLMECGDSEETPQAKRLKQVEAELEDAKARIQSLTAALERANAERAELLERYAGEQAPQEPKADEEEIPELPPQEPDKMTAVKSSLEEVSALLDQVTQLKAQLRVEKTANELLSEKFYLQNLEEPAAEDAAEPADEAEPIPEAEPEADSSVPKLAAIFQAAEELQPDAEPEPVGEPEAEPAEEPQTEPAPEVQPEPQKQPLSLDDVDMMVQKFFS